MFEQMKNVSHEISTALSRDMLNIIYIFTPLIIINITLSLPLTNVFSPTGVRGPGKI